MKRIIYFLFFVGIFLTNKQVRAQSEKSMFAISWEIGFPIENNNFLDKTSFAGGKIEYRYFVKPSLSIGGFLNWNSYYNYYPTATYENEDKTRAVTTDMYRYIYTLPMGLSTHYYFSGGKMIKPFVGIGLGAMYSEQNLYVNIFGAEYKNWGFLARPELGILIQPSSWDQYSILLGTTYSYSTNSNSDLGIDNLQNLNVQLGFVWKM